MIIEAPAKTAKTEEVKKINEDCAKTEEVKKINEDCYKIFEKLLTHPNINFIKECKELLSQSKENVTFGIIEQKLKNSAYISPLLFYKDIRSIWTKYLNIYLNDNDLYSKVNKLNTYFEAMISDIDNKAQKADDKKVQGVGVNQEKFHHERKEKLLNNSNTNVNDLKNSHNTKNIHHHNISVNINRVVKTGSNNMINKTNSYSSSKDRKIIQDEDEEDLKRINVKNPENSSVHKNKTIHKESDKISKNNHHNNSNNSNSSQPNIIKHNVPMTSLSKSNFKSEKDNNLNKIKPPMMPLKKNSITSTAINPSQKTNSPLTPSQNITKNPNTSINTHQMPTEEEIDSAKRIIEKYKTKLNNQDKIGIKKFISECNGVEITSEKLEFDIDKLSSKKLNELKLYIISCIENKNNEQRNEDKNTKNRVINPNVNSSQIKVNYN